MRKWKCIADTLNYEWFTVGGIYEEDEEGYVVDDQGYSWARGVESPVKYNGYKFEEVTDMFTKKDLKAGDVLITRNNRKYILLDDENLVNLVQHGYITVGDYKDDLTDKFSRTDWDIMKVYRKKMYADRPWELGLEEMDCMFNRVEVKEMTVEEISKALGYEVKVVKG